MLTLLVAFLVGCRKTEVQPKSEPTAVSAQSDDLWLTDDADNATDRRTPTEKLCAHSWMYQRYYIGYVDPENPGTLAYKRGSDNNTIDLDYIIVTYYPDGTSTENSNGNIIYGNWYFTDETAKEIVFTNYTGEYRSTILKLTNKTYIWYYTDIYGVNRAGQYVPFN